MSNNGSNTSNAGGTSSMSNASRGTRVVSAGDWVRMKRLLGARNNGYSSDGYLNPASSNFNKDVVPTTSLQVPYGLPIHVFPVGGNSKIRRPASNWIDNVAFNYGDIVLSSQQGVHQPGSIILAQRFCDCTTTNLANKDVVCRKCLTRKPQGQQQEDGYPTGGGGGGDGRIIVNWNGYDANGATGEGVCYRGAVGGTSLPHTFDPCVATFSFLFSNLLNIQNITQITIFATTVEGIPYDFTGFSTPANVSISGGGGISVSATDSGFIVLRITSPLTTSSVITLTNLNPERAPLFCILNEVCIVSEIPPVNNIDARTWSPPAIPVGYSNHVTIPTFTTFTMDGTGTQTLRIDFSDIPTTNGVTTFTSISGIEVGTFGYIKLVGGLGAITGTSPYLSSVIDLTTSILIDYASSPPSIASFQGTYLLIALDNTPSLTINNVKVLLS